MGFKFNKKSILAENIVIYFSNSEEFFFRFTLNDSLHITDIERSVTSPTSKYENAHSDLFSDPSIGSIEGIISSPRNEFHQKLLFYF